MANSSEIRDTDKKNLTSLRMLQLLGGNLNDAIAQLEAGMNEEDVIAVNEKIKEHARTRDS
jgi:hypothetical protein